MSDKLLDDRLDMRINEGDKSAFVEKCKADEIPHQVVARNLINAYTEDRVIVQPKPETQKS